MRWNITRAAIDEMTVNIKRLLEVSSGKTGRLERQGKHAEMDFSFLVMGNLVLTQGNDSPTRSLQHRDFSRKLSGSSADLQIDLETASWRRCLIDPLRRR
jgi:hypothetical protein